MADNGTYSIRLKLIDEATGKLAQFNKALRQAQAPVEKFNAQARMFGKLTGISSAINQLKGLSDTAMKAGLAVAGIGGVATIAGLANMAKEFAATGMQLTNMSKSLDIAAGKLYQFQGASKLAGLSSDAMASSVQSIQNAVNDAKWGRNIPALTAFRMSGVDIGKDDPDTIMRKASSMLEKHQKDWSAATKRNYLNVMGIGENMLPALAGGPQAYDARNAKSKALLGDTEGAAQAGRRLADALNEASLAGQGLGNSLMTTLEPVLTPLVGSVRDLILQWRDWITQNKSLIQSKVTEYLALFKQ